MGNMFADSRAIHRDDDATLHIERLARKNANATARYDTRRSEINERTKEVESRESPREKEKEEEEREREKNRHADREGEKESGACATEVDVAAGRRRKREAEETSIPTHRQTGR